MAHVEIAAGTRWAAVVIAAAVIPVAIQSQGSPAPAAVSLVDGRVAVRVPADWTVERRSTGPGPPRVRVGSPADPEAAVNILWNYAPEATLDGISGALRRAAAAEKAGAFDFTAAAVADRAAVTYRELRPGRVVRWSVLIDGSTRIAIGCQSAPDRESVVLDACEQAVRTAREVP